MKQVAYIFGEEWFHVTPKYEASEELEAVEYDSVVLAILGGIGTEIPYFRGESLDAFLSVICVLASVE